MYSEHLKKHPFPHSLPYRMYRSFSPYFRIVINLSTRNVWGISLTKRLLTSSVGPSPGPSHLHHGAHLHVILTFQYHVILYVNWLIFGLLDFTSVDDLFRPNRGVVTANPTMPVKPVEYDGYWYRSTRLQCNLLILQSTLYLHFSTKLLFGRNSI